MVQKYAEMRVAENSNKIFAEMDQMIKQAVEEQERRKKQKEEEEAARERDNREWDELFAELKQAESQVNEDENFIEGVTIEGDPPKVVYRSFF